MIEVVIWGRDDDGSHLIMDILPFKPGVDLAEAERLTAELHGADALAAFHETDDSELTFGTDWRFIKGYDPGSEV